MQRVAELAPTAQAIVVNGLPKRALHWMPSLETVVGKPIVASDVAPNGSHGRLMATLSPAAG